MSDQNILAKLSYMFSFKDKLSCLNNNISLETLDISTFNKFNYYEKIYTIKNNMSYKVKMKDETLGSIPLSYLYNAVYENIRYINKPIIYHSESNIENIKINKDKTFTFYNNIGTKMIELSFDNDSKLVSHPETRTLFEYKKSKKDINIFNNWNSRFYLSNYILNEYMNDDNTSTMKLIDIDSEDETIMHNIPYQIYKKSEFGGIYTHYYMYYKDLIDEEIENISSIEDYLKIIDGYYTEILIDPFFVNESNNGNILKIETFSPNNGYLDENVFRIDILIMEGV
jgi:hypothetical protein